MMGSAKSQWVFWCLLPRFTRYSLTLLLSAVMLADAVGATPRNRGLQIAQQPETAQQDATRAAAERIFQEGMQLYQKGTGESLRQAIGKWQEALKLWQQVDDKRWEANILLGIGKVYSDLGENQEALKYYNQALPIYRAVEDKGGEATTLNNIGLVYDDLGEKQEALKYYNQALTIFRAVEDKRGEATTLNNIGGVYSDLGEKQEALKYYNQALTIFRAVEDKGGEATTLNNIGSVYKYLGEKQEALKYYNQALRILRAVEDKRGEANTLNNIGSVYKDLGEKQEALKYYNQALPIRRAVEDRGGEATTLNNIGSVYHSLGEKQEALKYYNQALPIYRAVSDRGGEATTLHNIGSVYHSLGEKQEALKYYNQALPIRRAVEDREGEATTLNNIGGVYSDLGEKQEALKYYNQALPIRRAVEDRGGEATTLNNIGGVYSDLGEKQEALKYYNQALPIFRAVSDRGGEAKTLNNIGLVYDDLGEKQKALKYYNQALPIYRVVEDRGGEATTLSNIGLVYNDLGEKQEALKYYNQALPIFRAVEDRGGEANTLNNIGAVYSDLGEKQEALKYYNQALPIYRAVGDKRGKAAILNNIGAVYSDLGEKQEALKYFNQALPIIRAVGNREGEAATLSNMAVLEREYRANLQQAQTHIQAVIEIVEDLRTKIDSQELRTSFFATVQSYYKFYIDLLMQLHKKDPSKGYDALALHISERSRARGLVELLTQANVDIRKDIDPKLLAQERRLTLLLDARDKQLSELLSKKESPAQLVATTKQQIQDLLKQQQDLKTNIRANNFEYAALKYPQPLTLPQIQQQLDQDSLLLQYSLGEERSYLWVVTPNSLKSYELANSEKINKAAKNLNQLLKRPLIAGASPEEQAQAVTDTTKAAQELSQLIVAPVAGQLGQKRLVIVPDGILHQIPFAVLSDLTPQPPQGKGEQDQLKLPSPLPKGVGGEVNYQPLLVNHEIINLPSVTSLATQRQQLKGRKMAPKTIAVLADPVFSANDKRVTEKATKTYSSTDIELERSALERSLKNINRSGLDRLPGTRQEAEAVLKMVSPSESFQAFDFDANYNFATSKQLNQYRLLLFATHGIFDDINPELSGIVTSLVDKQGKAQKGFLRLNDIFNLDLPAELIVLSACESGVGQEVKGEGLVGLTRGLMYAGSPRVIVSLWKVNDQATSLLMQELYKQILQQDKSPAVALREAQLKLWQQKDWQNPRYWAAFSLQGEWRNNY
ncbi:CHAT domain-containing protein [Nostoc sphaeroides CHAB 2801]|uniref:CHAT domain-containing tetratricopeptide repeat protein n=2 Tax=Nostoc sphaeroides TaxID=446679 RepID=UPI001E33E84F|nr:CHAT domain-containing tetratricopeptide repeat protein [Nostoc sphaeroides]MCC5629840.1 CHAT domain-containing protein [Nostoc sphaeroides CHAB 2801]